MSGESLRLQARSLPSLTHRVSVDSDCTHGYGPGAPSVPPQLLSTRIHPGARRTHHPVLLCPPPAHPLHGAINDAPPFSLLQRKAGAIRLLSPGMGQLSIKQWGLQWTELQLPTLCGFPHSTGCRRSGVGGGGGRSLDWCRHIEPRSCSAHACARADVSFPAVCA